MQIKGLSTWNPLSVQLRTSSASDALFVKRQCIGSDGPRFYSIPDSYVLASQDVLNLSEGDYSDAVGILK